MKKITIRNLEEKTAQEVFDFVAKHLLTQKKKSQRNAIGSKDCMYKSPEGLTCAVGCLIPKKDYTYDIEYRGVEDMLEYYDVVSKHEMLLTHLQLVHDTEEVENWQEALNIKAEKFKLKNYTLKIKKKKTMKVNIFYPKINDCFQLSTPFVGIFNSKDSFGISLGLTLIVFDFIYTKKEYS